MHIGIAVDNDWVAPRLDCAEGMILAEIREGESKQCSYISVSVPQPWAWIRVINDSGIEQFVCGGVDRMTAMLLEETGIMIVSWVTGKVDAVLVSLAAGTLEPHAILNEQGGIEGHWAGCRGRGHGLRRRCGRGRPSDWMPGKGPNLR